MRFRAKIFLAVLLPASLLVGLSVIVALVTLRRNADEAARQAFGQTSKAVTELLLKNKQNLDRLEKTFSGPIFQEIVEKGADPQKREGLKSGIANDLDALNLKLDFFGIAGPDGKVWLRVNEPHSCTEKCRHDGEAAWILHQEASLFGTAGEPYMGRRVLLVQQNGAIILGRNLKEELRGIQDLLKVELALRAGKTEVYRSLPIWTASETAEGDVDIGGIHYLSTRSPLEGMGDTTLLTLRDMRKADQDRAFALLLGMSALVVAVLIGTLVSIRISRGVSKPVEALVGAVKKVALGEFETKVEVVGKDEIGALGEAFNEMTVGLRKRQEIMEKTLSRDVAEEFLKGGTERGGERRVITIIFMDIRGYTSGTEGMDPADVVVMLNELMDLLAGAIERHGGLVNKFLGDGLMAMFGAPKPLENHPLKAVEAGIEMQKQMERWNHRRTARGLPSFYSGIGINTGEVVCGKVGGRSRLEYTLIGEEVNLTSRICGKAAPRQVLITKQTWLKVKEQVQVRELEAVSVKGLSYPIQIYEVLG